MNNMMRGKKMQIAMYAVMALLLIAVIIMAVFLGMYTSDRANYSNRLENTYAMAYYDLVESMASIENGLTKFGVISTKRLQEQQLEQVMLAAKTASHSVLTFANESNSTRPLEKFINQVFDYSGYLVRKIEDGDGVNDEEKKTVQEMASLTRDICKRLAQLGEKMTEDFSFVNTLGSDKDIFADMFDDLNGEQGVTFPTLIYDGPFSDGVTDREPLGIHGDEITENEATTLAVSVYLKGYEVDEVGVIAKNEYRIPAYLINATIKGEQERDVSLVISKRGGMLLDMDMYREVGEPELKVEEARVVAEQYLQSIGIKNMKAVWANVYGSQVYINLCYTDKEIVHYPDMIKLIVSLDTGEIMGYEGMNYAFNHTDRKLSKPKLSEEEIIVDMAANFDDGFTCRLALIPLTTMTERLTYEISGTINGERYFIYVDANTGDEVNILRVIDSSQGELLM